MSTLSLSVRCGQFEDRQACRAALGALVTPPDVSIVEPRVAFAEGAPVGALQGFVPVATGMPDLSRTPFVELLLCWPHACLRVVAGAGPVRWASLTIERYIAPLGAEGAPAPALDGLTEQPRQRVCWRSRDDIGRFMARSQGVDLTRALYDMQFDVREFQRGGATVAWWLVPVSGKREASGE